MDPSTVRRIPTAGSERDAGVILPNATMSTKFMYVDAQKGPRSVVYPGPDATKCQPGASDCTFRCIGGNHATYVHGDAPGGGKHVFRTLQQTLDDTRQFIERGSQPDVPGPIDGSIGGARDPRDATTTHFTAGGLPETFGQPDAPSIRLLSGQTGAATAPSLTNINTGAGYGFAPAFPEAPDLEWE